MRTQLRLEILLVSAVIAIAWLTWAVWVVDFRARHAASFIDVAATGGAVLCSCTTLFFGATRRWQRGAVVAGLYLVGLILAAVASGTLAYFAIGYGLAFSGGWDIGSGAKRDQFWSIADTLLWHLLFLLSVGAVVYVTQKCWNAPLAVSASARGRFQFSLRTIVLVTVVLATVISGITQLRTRRTRFQEALWQEDAQARQFMLDDLLGSYPLVDMRQRDATRL